MALSGRACRHVGMTELEEAALTEGHGPRADEVIE
jgi:hypothetical protein